MEKINEYIEISNIETMTDEEIVHDFEECFASGALKNSLGIKRLQFDEHKLPNTLISNNRHEFIRKMYIYVKEYNKLKDNNLNPRDYDIIDAFRLC